VIAVIFEINYELNFDSYKDESRQAFLKFYQMC